MRIGFEPTYNGFANRCLTTWLPHRDFSPALPGPGSRSVHPVQGSVKLRAGRRRVHSAVSRVPRYIRVTVRIALGSDEKTYLVDEIARELERRGHSVTAFGAAAGTAEPWAATALSVAEGVARGDYDSGVVCCWTGTGVSIAANKVPGIRAALCGDAATARGARKWNDANVLALSLRATAPEGAREILEAWLSEPYGGTEAPSLDAIRAREND